MKTATIKLYKSILVSDIDGQTFKRVDGVLAGESDQLKNAISSDAEEALDRNIIYRHFESRDSKIRRRLAFCLVQEESDTLSVTNELDVEKESFDYELMVPDSCDRQRLKAIAQNLHNYILQGTLHDWYATQNMKGNVSAAELEEMESSIVSMLRSSYVKRPLQPFGPRN